MLQTHRRGSSTGGQHWGSAAAGGGSCSNTVVGGMAGSSNRGWGRAVPAPSPPVTGKGAGGVVGATATGI